MIFLSIQALDRAGHGVMVYESKLLGCPFCGCRVSPTEVACPRCGNKFSSDTQFECPFCGDLVPSGATKCPSCHVDFGEFQEKSKRLSKTDSIDTLLMDLIKLEASEIKKVGKKFSCPTCDLLLDGSEEICPRCQAGLTDWAAFQCPTCGAFVDAHAVKCSECDAVFAGGEPAVDEEKVAADHESVSSALTEILTAAGQTGPLPEPELKPVIVEEPPEQPPEPEKIAEPEPAPEPYPTPEPEVQPEPVPAEPPIPAAPKKMKQRKLKTKPSGGAK